VTDSTLGNGLRTVKSLDQVTGWVDYIQSGPGGGTSVQNLSYLWDRVGNLTQRQDNNQGLTENAYYDNLHRLLSSTVSGGSSLTMTYAPNGNVLTKALTGTGAYSYNYAYHATKLHAVASVSGSASLSYTYDANGNLTNRAGTTLSWFASNLPKAITKNSQNSSTFQYAPNGQRWRHAYKTGNVTFTHIYVGRLLEKVTQGSAVDWKHYVHAEGEIVALYSRKSSGTNTLSYLLQDHLGSTDAITASSGAVTVKESFDAFGKRRGTAWSGSPTSGELSTINGLTRRGYTAHEMLDSTDLIHMNGRVYDPLIARFASADPYTPSNLGTQAFNRFAYVGNNPLSFTDPSGFSRIGMTRPQAIDPCGAPGGCVDVTAPRLRNDIAELGFNTHFSPGLGPTIYDIDPGAGEFFEVLVEDQKDADDTDAPPFEPPVMPFRSPAAGEGDGDSLLCVASRVLAGAAGGVTATVVFSALTGNLAGLTPAALVAGAAIGGVGGLVGPGLVGAAASGAVSIATRVSGGYSTGGLAGMGNDALGGAAAPAFAVPAGAAGGAVYGAVSGATGFAAAGPVLSQAGAVGSGILGGTAGGLAAAAAVGASSLIYGLVAPAECTP
jgi:RHS repeat-associated protein